MTMTLMIRLADTSAALERLLRVIRVRGFYLEHCQVSQHEDAGYEVRVTLSGQRCMRNLQRQIDKLHEVSAVLAVSDGRELAAVSGSLEGIAETGSPA